MKRRQFLGAVAALGVAGAATGAAMLPREGRAPLHNLAAVEKLLESLRGVSLQAIQGWSPAKVFSHCAQSIDFSLDGFPQMKSEWFRQSVGALAFTLFSVRGAMRHPLDEPIPGAPELVDGLDQESALERLRLAFARFASHQGPLQPHFAYGQLSHAEYLQAHIMHLSEHMSLIKPA